MKEKIVIITGAASGIGLATAKTFLQKGNVVIMADLNKGSLNEATDKLNLNGYELLGVPTDVTKVIDCKKLIDTVIDKYGRIDVMINNAGISMRSLFNELDLSVIHKLMEVNFWGTANCSYYAMPYLLKTKGSLVAITSIAGKHGLPGRTGYSASKFAVQGLMETIRIENLKSGLHVLTFAPGFTATNVRRSALTGDGSQQGDSPLQESKLMQPDEIAHRIFRAVKKRKREVVVGLHGKGTLFGNFFLPRLLDRAYYFYMSREPDSPFQ